MMAFYQNDQICGLLETYREEVLTDSWWVSGSSLAATSLTDHKVTYSY